MSHRKPRIMIVDDERSVRESLREWFLEDGFEVVTAEDGLDALKKLDSDPFDLLVVDLKMPRMDGISLQRRLRETHPDLTIIILTAFASVETAVEALKLGAFDYVTKPVDPDELSHTVRRALERKQLTDENARLRDKVTQLATAAPIVGSSRGMERVMELVGTVAETDASVVIRGESGTGKELIARAIHGASPRRFFPIVAVNCGAIPETLLESELFGHEKGAFTGAHYRRKGKLELANGGTLFLDEIGEIPAKMQVDLLRVLESHRFNRLGGAQEIESDFRLVCATNRDLEALVKEGRFREDLYYRIHVFSIEIPPLRERREDIPLLVEHFVEKLSRSMGKPSKQLSEESEELLQAYDWPGNVRELENAIERAMVIGTTDSIRPQDLPLQVEQEGGTPRDRSLESLESEHIARVLREESGNVSQAARVLGIDRGTLYNKIKKYGIRSG
ncbi:MAG: sigma-54 dependent transcriptional regulator [marine benthic group bacterium]|nr:sigma-54 dependent transcriptional regulator [Gemmatimonadota bacterium]MCL7963075.1 sigma-54 dependent transcriptional regulator [Candidatus Carthagonibacter metallireducens]MCL7936553.1 sigma-54 dependent transcriptional regulator [Gemmatimonadota bacterium]MCL7958319.1 sigma-54 dependent transcriptional regulator [Gemmatimonadota bacterium]MCL7965083.1 sigma-54 dependent transcriptional regulator [Gemmatimonadota bacterium]